MSIESELASLAGGAQLLTCPVCEGSVSSAAPSCPHCGQPFAAQPVPQRIIVQADRPRRGASPLRIVLRIVMFTLTLAAVGFVLAGDIEALTGAFLFFGLFLALFVNRAV